VHSFAGKVTGYSTSRFGGRAIIDRAAPSSQCGSVGVSVGWILLTPWNDCNSTMDNHAQIGSGKLPTHLDDAYTFTEYIGQSCGYNRDWWGVNNNAATYDVYRIASSGHIAMKKNGTVLIQTPFDTQGFWGDSWAVQFAGETWHLAVPQNNFHADTLPGSASNKVKFESLMTMSSNGTFDYITSFGAGNLVNYDPTHFNRENYTSGYPSADFRIYDDRN
jgi:hypothetical protein